MNTREQRAERSSLWQTHHQQQRNSGLSIEAYCRREGISKQSFYQWRRRLENESQQPPPSTPLIRFAEIQTTGISAPGPATSPIRVRLSTGHEVEIGCGADTATIQEVLRTLLAASDKSVTQERA